MFWNNGKNGNFQWLVKEGEVKPNAQNDGVKPGDILLELGTSTVYVYYTDGNWYEI